MEKNDFLKGYIQVNQRIAKFYEKYPEGSIQTHIVTLDNEKVVVKAYAYKSKDDPLPSTGHAEEIRNSNYINRTSAVENCETSAVGRALANLGFEIKHGIASKEEMQIAIDKRAYNEKNNSMLIKKQLFNAASQKGVSNTQFKSICEGITNKKSSNQWTMDDLAKINSYLNSLETH